VASNADAPEGEDGFILPRGSGAGILGGTGHSLFAWYTGMLKDTILDTLSDEDRLRHGNYVATVRIWVAKDGHIERVKLAQSTGDSARDSIIEARLAKLMRVHEAPPLEMPQPITLQIISRG